MYIQCFPPQGGTRTHTCATVLLYPLDLSLYPLILQFMLKHTVHVHVLQHSLNIVDQDMYTPLIHLPLIHVHVHVV